MNASNLAPICLFTYNRLEETKQTIAALQKNRLANQSELFVFSDGPKDNIESAEKVAEVRNFLKEITGFKSIMIIESLVNKGLANSITSGVSEIVAKYGKVIVLEDDIITSKGFLSYMNNGLDYYEKHKKVMQISSFMFPIDPKGLPDTFFYTANTCWGWATWADAWKLYNDDTSQILQTIKKNNITWKEFNSLQGNEFKKQLIKNYSGKMKTWAVKWHAAIIINKGTVLHPKESFVSNIGFMGNGENCGVGNTMGHINDNLSLSVKAAERYNGIEHLNRLKLDFRKRYSLIEKIKRKLLNYGIIKK